MKFSIRKAFNCIGVVLAALSIPGVLILTVTHAAFASHNIQDSPGYEENRIEILEDMCVDFVGSWCNTNVKVMCIDSRKYILSTTKEGNVSVVQVRTAAGEDYCKHKE